jgi:hypothetical protein
VDEVIGTHNETARVVRRKTNRRHMTSDHQGQAAERATLLVRAVDEVLGTHSVIHEYRLVA